MRRMFAVLLVALLAACGGDGDGGGSAGNEASEACEEDLSDTSAKPTLCAPSGDPPKELVIDDAKQGDGAEAAAGATVKVHYVGIAWSTGKQFDASWDRGEPIEFGLSGVIKGWQDGIPGMKVGGRRKLTIPPNLAYGAQPPPGSGIGPNETLVFVVDLLEVQA